MARRPTVLVVDDDPAARKLMAAVLGPAGFAVHLAFDGQEALDLMDAGFRPSVVLLDFMMPVLDGPALHRAMRARPALRDIPVVGLTAGDVEAEFECVTKPPHMGRLVARLHVLATESAARARARRRRRLIAALVAAGIAGVVKVLIDRVWPRRRRGA